jgi:hypothetical protein
MAEARRAETAEQTAETDPNPAANSALPENS